MKQRFILDFNFCQYIGQPRTRYIKKGIIDCVAKCMKEGLISNQNIAARLIEKNLGQLKYKQISNLKQRITKQNAGAPNVDLGGLFVWCKAKSTVPVDDDEVFCGAIEYDLDEKDEIKDLRVIMVTKRLLSLTLNGNYFY